ncbi:MAG: tyrosine-type recombinase/integrase [Oscillospiraceae bacterium]
MIAGHLQQKKGYWYMVLNMYEETGKRKSKWIATHLPVQGNKRRAEEMLLRTRQQYSDLYDQSNDGELLFADYMLQWLAKMKSKISPTTYHSYKCTIESGICPYFRERRIPLSKLCAADLEEYYEYLQKKGISPNTAIHHHANIHKALKDAVRLDLVARNVAEIAERPRKEKYLPAHYSAEEVNQLLDKLQGNWMYVPVALSVFYGLRRSEVLGLQWGNVDFESKTVSIQHTRIYEETDGKETAVGRDVLKRKSSYRTLPMPDSIWTLLYNLKSVHYGDDSAPVDAYVCLNREGKPIAPNYFTQCFKQFLRDHNLREIRLHDLRHTCASILIQNRVPLIEVQQWLGHSTLETTADLYAHLEYESKVGNAELLKKI